MAIKYSVGVSSTARDRSLLERRRASSSRASGSRNAAPQERASRQQVSSEISPRGRGWLLMTDVAVDELAESQAFWAW
jgi:hypothetical protein